jgi:uncharacterized protein YjbI with pentapeptide repeats
MKHDTKPGWNRWQRPPPQDDRWARWGFRGMTVRDWLDVLIVPVMIALFAGFFTIVQAFWQTAAEDARQQALADQTAQIQQFIEKFRVQEASLQEYLDLMTNLLLNHDLRGSHVGDEVRAIAQTQTLTTLRKMDTQGKQTVVLFLRDAGLIQSSDYLGGSNERPIISLMKVDLTSADLSGAELFGAEMVEANLSEASLRGTDLSDALLAHANLRGADLRDADLTAADVRGADLSEANLSDADLSLAILSDANLSFANLRDAEGLTEEQVTEAHTLEGATMPNGQRYEEWLKDQEGSGEDEDNTGTS